MKWQTWGVFTFTVQGPEIEAASAEEAAAMAKNLDWSELADSHRQHVVDNNAPERIDIFPLGNPSKPVSH